MNVVTKDVPDTRRQDVDCDKEDSLFSYKPYSPSVGIRDVASSIVKCHLTLVGEELIHRHDWAVHLCVLEFKVKEVTILFSMNNVDLAKVKRQVAGGGRVVHPCWSCQLTA